MKGKCQKIDFYPNTSKAKITKLVQWGNLEANSYCFSDCTNLEGEIPIPSKNSFKLVTNLEGLFNNCSKLTGSIPNNLFKGADRIESFGVYWGLGAFKNCSGLTGSIPENLFKTCNKVTNYQSVFAGCKGLTGEIPSKLFSYSPDANNFTSTFGGCSSITSASDIFNGKNKIKNFNSTFFVVLH